MKKTKWTQLTLLWCLALMLLNADFAYASHEEDNLETLCIPIAQTNSTDPIFTAEFMSEYLLNPFMKAVSLAPQDERATLVSLVIPWTNQTQADHTEIMQRFGLIDLTQKLVTIPVEDRTATMKALNTFVDLMMPIFKERMKENEGAVAPCDLARRTLMLTMVKIPPAYWKRTLERTLPALQTLSSSDVDLHYRSLIKEAALKEGFDISDF